MADSAIEVTPGSGSSIDTRTEATNGNHRQVVVLGDPSTNAGVAPVDATNGLAVDVKAIAAGDNNIGNVDVVTLPALPAGTNNIGDVDVLSVPADPFGTNDDAAATAGSTGSIQAKLRLMTSQLDSIKTAVETLDNAISGSEIQADVLTLPAIPTGSNTIGAVLIKDGAGDTVAVDAFGNMSTLASGNIAHDEADSGYPLKMGAKAESSPKGITLVADGDRTDAYADIDGVQMVKLNTSFGDLISERVSNTDGNSTAFTNFSAVASTKNYVTGYSIFRTDSGTTPIYVDFRDGAGGSILWSVVIPPNSGAHLSSAMPLFKTSANTALAYDVSAATTTVYISVTGFQSKVT